MTAKNEQKPSQRSQLSTKSRGWCFTLHDYKPFYDKIVDELAGLSTYAIIGKETCPTTGRKHLQGYAYFKNAISGKSFKDKLCETAHIEKANGNPSQNRIYCSKENDFQEFGYCPEQGKRNDLVRLKEQLKHGATTINEIMDQNPHVYHLYGRTLKDLNQMYTNEYKRIKRTKCLWFCGSTGCGKTVKAQEVIEALGNSVYMYHDDKGWWDRYNGEKVVLIDEFRGCIQFAEMLLMLDYKPWSVRQRNSPPRQFVSELVIVTSPLRPENVYKSDNVKDSINQLLRRVEVIDFDATGRNYKIINELINSYLSVDDSTETEEFKELKAHKFELTKPIEARKSSETATLESNQSNQLNQSGQSSASLDKKVKYETIETETLVSNQSNQLNQSGQSSASLDKRVRYETIETATLVTNQSNQLNQSNQSNQSVKTAKAYENNFLMGLLEHFDNQI